VLPSTPIFEQKFANQIADRVKVENERGSILGHIRVELARAFHSYLSDQASQISRVVPEFLDIYGGATYVLRQIQSAMTYVDLHARKYAPESNELDY
jgi:hypothetical protein